MPFEIAPQTEEQQRQILGRIALGAIADYILTVPPEKFDMAKWCGTACCAIGHGVTLPEVQATGLRMVPSPDGFDVRQSHFPAFLSTKVEDLGSVAIAEAFGITEYQATSLFSGRLIGSSREEVSANIKRFLAGEILQQQQPHAMDWGSAFTWIAAPSSPINWIAIDECRAPTVKPAAAPAKKVRVSAKNGATWPVAKGCYA